MLFTLALRYSLMSTLQQFTTTPTRANAKRMLAFSAAMGATRTEMGQSNSTSLLLATLADSFAPFGQDVVRALQDVVAPPPPPAPVLDAYQLFHVRRESARSFRTSVALAQRGGYPVTATREPFDAEAYEFAVKRAREGSSVYRAALDALAPEDALDVIALYGWWKRPRKEIK